MNWIRKHKCLAMLIGSFIVIFILGFVLGNTGIAMLLGAILGIFVCVGLTKVTWKLLQRIGTKLATGNQQSHIDRRR